MRDFALSSELVPVGSGCPFYPKRGSRALGTPIDEQRRRRRRRAVPRASLGARRRHAWRDGTHDGRNVADGLDWHSGDRGTRTECCGADQVSAQEVDELDGSVGTTRLVGGQTYAHPSLRVRLQRLLSSDPINAFLRSSWQNAASSRELSLQCNQLLTFSAADFRRRQPD